MEYRVDTGGINKYEITSQGYLRAWATIARIGVQTYYNADGSPRRELRSPEEVSSPESLASFGLKPHTIDHPPEFLHSKNTRAYQTGSTDSTVFYQQGFVNVAINVIDSEAIEEIQSGRRAELSAGYTCELDFSPGMWRGQKYDAIQRNIRGNHVSSVARGRAGPNVKMHVDTWSSRPLKKKAFHAKLDNLKTMGGNPEEKKPEPATEPKEDSLPPTTERREDVQARRIKVLETRVRDRDDNITALESQLTEIQKEVQQARSDEAIARSDLDHHKRTYSDTICTEVTSRIDAWNKAKDFLPKGLSESPDPKMTADEIKRAAVENSNPGVNLEGCTSDHINGCFDMMMHSHKPKRSSTKPLIQAVENAFNAGSTKDSRSKAMKEDDKAWMRKN